MQAPNVTPGSDCREGGGDTETENDKVLPPPPPTLTSVSSHDQGDTYRCHQDSLDAEGNAFCFSGSDVQRY